MSKKIAYGGILLAINIILLMIINIIPINTLFLMGLASLIVSIIIMEFGIKSGIAFYLGSIILGFIVMANKSQWILYSLTFGLYGLVKYIIEQNKSIYIEYTLKIVFANVMIFIAYFLIKSFVYIPMNIIILLFAQIIFLLYDYMYTLFIDYYKDKLRRILNRVN